MKRIRDQLRMNGAQTLSTTELLALALFQGEEKDALLQAHTLLERYGVKGLRTVPLDVLSQEGGLSSTQVEWVQVVCELAQRFAKGDPGDPVQIISPYDAIEVLQPLLAHLDHEEFRVLVLDSRNHVLANILLYTGTVNETSLRAPEIFRQAIVRNCPGILLAHNHPSNDPTPSPDDLETTKKLLDAARLLDIDLIDHIIIGGENGVSLKEVLLWE